MSLGKWRHNYPPALQAESPHSPPSLDPRARPVPLPRKQLLTQTWPYASVTLLIELVVGAVSGGRRKPSCRRLCFVHPPPNKPLLHDDLVRTGALDVHPRRGPAIRQWRASEDLLKFLCSRRVYFD